MGLFVTKSFPWWARVREERHAPRDPLNPFTEDARQLATADRYFFPTPPCGCSRASPFPSISLFSNSICIS